MTNGEAINWIINISADIGKAEHRDLWHYEQALSEIKEMLETAQSDPQSPCDLCVYNPPSSMDSNPCCICVAEPLWRGEEHDKG